MTINDEKLDMKALFIQGQAHFSKEEYAQAEECLIPPAKKGNRGAQLLLAYLYEVSEEKRDPEKALFWYGQAGARGDATAIDAMIRLYRAAGAPNKDKLRYWVEKKEKLEKETK